MNVDFNKLLPCFIKIEIVLILRSLFSQIVFIDLILAGDNAIIIGMVASKFPPTQRKKVIFLNSKVFLHQKIKHLKNKKF